VVPDPNRAATGSSSAPAGRDGGWGPLAGPWGPPRGASTSLPRAGVGTTPKDPGAVGVSGGPGVPGTTPPAPAITLPRCRSTVPGRLGAGEGRGTPTPLTPTLPPPPTSPPSPQLPPLLPLVVVAVVPGRSTAARGERVGDASPSTTSAEEGGGVGPTDPTPGPAPAPAPRPPVAHAAEAGRGDAGRASRARCRGDTAEVPGRAPVRADPARVGDSTCTPR
jgi:hypothetical protein